MLEGDTPRLIDEWQEVPPLWDAVRYEVDRRAQKGQFILTGSATPNHKGIMHSGAGRTGKLRMRPMSLYESGDSSGKISLGDILNGTMQQASFLAKEYLNTVIDDDVFRMDGVKRDTQKMRLLLRSLARNESTTATNRTLKNDIKEINDKDIDIDTVAAYWDIFNCLFLTESAAVCL